MSILSANFSLNVGLVSLQSNLINYSARQHVFKPIVLLVAGLALAIFGGVLLGRNVSRYRLGFDYGHLSNRLYSISASDESLRSNPSKYIKNLASSIRSAGFNMSITVGFNQHSSTDRAVDGGGPTRQFFNLLFQSLKTQFSSAGTKPADFHPYINKNGTTLVPQGQPTNDPKLSIFYDIGTIMMYVFFNHASPLIGPVFHESFFAAILSLEDHEIDLPYDLLPDTTKLKMCKALIHTQQASGEYFNSYLAPLALLEKGEQATEDEINSEQILHFYASAALESTGNGPRDLFLLPGGDEVTLEGIQFDMDAIRNDKRGFFQNCFNALLQQKTDSLGTIGLTLFPIHTMAKAMIELAGYRWREVHSSTSSSNTASASFETADPQVEAAKRLQRKIQGMLDREDIVSHITSCSIDPIVTQQVDWIKQWILDPETTDTLIEGLLTFWTGSSYVDWEKVENIIVMSSWNGGLLPEAMTCSRILNVSSSYSPRNARGELGLLHNHTAEGYYQVLNKIAGEYSNVYTNC